jgi:hypothetical protein
VTEWRTPLIVLAWIPVTLGLDRGASLQQQHLLGVMTWVLLVWLLRRENNLVRMQTAVVIVFATLVEYTFSPWLEVYSYRFENVPAFVPPGHGLVYLAALCMGRSSFFRTHSRSLVTLTVVLGGLYALWGVSPLAPRPDVLGLFWYGCLLGFLAFGRSRLLYVGAFVVVTYLEWIGTWVGTWAWQPYPPSGAAGGYGWFDLAAITIAPTVVAWWSRFRSRGRELPQQEGVEQSVGRDRIATDHR